MKCLRCGLKETWKDAIGYEGEYRVSSIGRIRSLARKTMRLGHQMRIKGKILTPSPTVTGGYYVVNFRDGELQKIFRVVMLAFKGKTPVGFGIDHKDRNPKHDCISNLRFATSSQNCANSTRKISKDGYRGIYLNSNRYTARIAGKYIGRFDTRREAALAYNNAAINRWGDFASLNPIS